jgi:hypothetical protein
MKRITPKQAAQMMECGEQQGQNDGSVGEDSRSILYRIQTETNVLHL